ncbi:glycosyltransferase family 4 protein [Paenibacillus alvei]|uniref:Glycosyltransferase family 4 protein n=1 Tax=Paenibacillus alvei TaxID=44250 RepID=A0AAP6ZYS1_PAEAL|nr:glycosyltransferase family 4 protein [Paenibacillus alvei]MBG9736821.1 glycosyl transferase family 2 protein [Paenibacillus alvei]MBG9746977.1 glycosyl transferase family 2 protein [Paenibacillus alvei]MCY9582004.1 glycosyltransferase family 4 protein [Paenibacillus alvei]MCY9585902.1 glycosyltransferase family 4 protein [Paenibacillus alvei]NOJ70366.1 glycosyltransferase family 4 protein [Paenibacillus alvei]
MAQIIWHSNVFDSTGYAKATRQYVLALHAAGADVKLETHHGLPEVALPPNQRATLDQLLMKRRRAVQKTSIFHYIPEFWRKKLRPTFGFTYWETSKIPESWKKQISQMNGVLLPSLHNMDVFRRSGVQVPLFYVRPCLTEPYQAPSMEYVPPYVHQLPPFRFLSVCSWIDRKGIDLLLKTFWQEFRAEDPVCLIIKSLGNADIYHVVDKLKQEMRLAHATAPVYIDLELRSEMEMDALYRSSHAFVLPSRGEGVGYPVLEAAMRGVPVIATGWGGHTDFLNDYNGYLIPFQLVPVKPQPYYKGYQSDQLWAESSIDSLRGIMRHVMTHYEEAAAKGQLAKQHTLTHFSPDKAARDIIDALSQITGYHFV